MTFSEPTTNMSDVKAPWRLLPFLLAHCAVCVRSLDAQAAFRKGHDRVRAFGTVFVLP